MKETKTILLALSCGGPSSSAAAWSGRKSPGARRAAGPRLAVCKVTACSATPPPFLGRGHHGFGDFDGFGGRSFPFGRLALGTTVQTTFYDGDPAAGGNVTDTLNFAYGQDSEVAFAQALDEAQQNAQYATVNVGEQTRTVDLSGVTVPTSGRGLLPRELAGARGLQEDGTLTATFYSGDPAANGQVTDTLSFTYGQDSEAGFADSFATAAENATFVTVTTSPQTYTVNLAEAQAQGFDSRGSGPPGFDQGRRGRR